MDGFILSPHLVMLLLLLLLLSVIIVNTLAMSPHRGSGGHYYGNQPLADSLWSSVGKCPSTGHLTSRTRIVQITLLPSPRLFPTVHRPNNTSPHSSHFSHLPFSTLLSTLDTSPTKTHLVFLVYMSTKFSIS